MYKWSVPNQKKKIYYWLARKKVKIFFLSFTNTWFMGEKEKGHHLTPVVLSAVVKFVEALVALIDALAAGALGTMLP